MLIAALLALAGCSAAVRAAKDAEERKAIVQKSGSLGELCAASRAVQAAWLNAKDEEQFKQAKLFADVDCMSASMLGSDLPADEVQRAKITNISAEMVNTAESTLVDTSH